MDRAWSRLAAIVCVLAVLVAACGSATTASPSSTATAQPSPTATAQPSPTATAQPSPTATATPSPSPVPATPSPTAVPTAAPTGYEPQPDGTIVWYTDSGDRQAVPAIDGLTAEVQGGKTLYMAKAANSYGLKAGAYAGAFIRYVKVEDKQTGGVVLEPQVVNKLIQDKLATIPNQADKWVAPIPLNITDATADTDVALSFASEYPTTNVKVATVGFQGSLEVTDIVPGSDGRELVTLTNMNYGNTYYSQFMQDHRDGITLGEEMSFLSVSGNFQADLPPTVETSFGKFVCKASGSIVIGLLLGNGGSDLTSDKALYLPDTNVPVFVAHKA
jgi:hypothetical protein